MLLLFNQKKQAFTLIEVLVSTTIFFLVFTAAIGIFTSSMQGKTRVNQIKEIEDNARYAMELMSREIRMAQDVSINERNTADSEIDFTDSSGQSVRFCRADSNGACNPNGNYLARNNSLVTSNRVKITNLIFNVNNFDFTNGPQPKVTILKELASNKNPSVKLKFQTTISPKVYKRP